MADRGVFPAIPNDEIENFQDDVRAGIVESGGGSTSSNPVDDAFAEQLDGIVPSGETLDAWAAKTNIRDSDEVAYIIEIAFKISILRRYNMNGYANTLEEMTKQKLRLMTSVDAKMLEGLFDIFEAFGGGGRGPGENNPTGVLARIQDDVTPPDDD